ncbi:FGGY-family carbohydrate kinase [Chitinophaga lutea]
MQPVPVIAVFDIGKTNKKLFLFDEGYQIVFERTERLEPGFDEDGDPCEDLAALRRFVSSTLEMVLRDARFDVKAVNCSAYGASLVHTGADGSPLTPLYDYLKPYPSALRQSLYERYGGQAAFCRQTASPALGSLNSGLQLYRLKMERPALFAQIRHTLHLPQYLAFLLTGQPCSDLTSIGCHTHLWDFERQAYHRWVSETGLVEKLAPLLPGRQTLAARAPGARFVTGTGLHDSSAALIPYLLEPGEPFALLSTGTWCITLNPFNDTPLTEEELAQDCLCYLTYDGRPVKASRLFAGQMHEDGVKKLSAKFHVDLAHFHTMPFQPEIIAQLRRGSAEENASFAYHALMLDIMEKQRHATNLALHGSDVKRLYVDGGFSNNEIFMRLLADVFPHMQVCAASVPQATAIGAAMAIHEAWNTSPLPAGIVRVKDYSAVVS